MSPQHRLLPRKQLGFFPTPLVALDRLSDRLGGPRILMKRDDQTGLASGGNKTRKLEFLLGEALEQGCETVITGGTDNDTVIFRHTGGLPTLFSHAKELQQ